MGNFHEEIAMQEQSITNLVSDILDDAAAASAPDVAHALANKLIRLSYAAKCRAAAIGLRLDGNVNMAIAEERMSQNNLRIADLEVTSLLHPAEADADGGGKEMPWEALVLAAGGWAAMARHVRRHRARLDLWRDPDGGESRGEGD